MDKNGEKVYQITLNEKHCRVIVKALDAYLRLGMGQLEAAIGDNVEHFREKEGVEKNWNVRHHAMVTLKRILTGFVSGASESAASDRIPDTYHVAHDMEEVIRNRIAWDEHPEGGSTVDFHPPMKISQAPLIEIKRVETEAERIEKKGF